MLITPENAREMGARGAIARRQKKEAEALRLKALEQALKFGQQSAGPMAVPSDYSKQINRLHWHIDRVDAMLDECKEPILFVKLAQARACLQEQWTHLAQIPKPGSRRPGKAKDAGKTTAIAPIEE